MKAFSRHFQPGECPRRGLLRDCTTSPINRLQHQSQHFCVLILLPIKNIWISRSIFNLKLPPSQQKGSDLKRIFFTNVFNFCGMIPAEWSEKAKARNNNAVLRGFHSICKRKSFLIIYETNSFSFCSKCNTLYWSHQRYFIATCYTKK